ncbi:glycosyltransferase family 1 protein [Paenibacillus kobensis]|uniref:glycosyltransferase family 1 protein n=1 Tax=Paenibacillus kobensis TaxID=59841 RepID=UPI000FD7AAE5|nr:glycosyltransferase family 1 protein [Paenibacillus kobensis]
MNESGSPDMPHKGVPDGVTIEQYQIVIKDKYPSDAFYHAQRYDFTEEDLLNNRKVIETDGAAAPYKTALWIIPQFLYPYYGGIHTIFRFADFLTRNYGIRNTFAVQGVLELTNQPSMIAEAFPLLADSDFYHFTNENFNLSHIPDHDLGFCTAWQTAYPLLKFNRVKKKFYFMQDFEPYFYPAGSISGLAEATYRFGFTAICNTVALKTSYEAYGGKAVHFTPSLDRNVFYYKSEPKPFDGVYKVLFYGRPFGIRNCFEVAVQALILLKHCLGQRVEIISAGGGWDVKDYGLEHVMYNVATLPYEETGEMFRFCDVGLTMMMTRHTSYIPIQLMACGCLVVTNKSEWKDWLLRDDENCMLCEPAPTHIAQKLLDALLNKPKRERLVAAALETAAQTPSWEDEFKRVTSEILG